MTKLSKFFLRLLKFTRIWYYLGLGPIFGRLVLLLTTKGRRSGRPRVTPLQYEEEEGVIYVASALGTQADWFRNITADPNVEVWVKDRRFAGIAETITDPARIADFLELRMARHPKMMGMMFRASGLPPHPDRLHLEQFAASTALVAIRPG